MFYILQILVFQKMILNLQPVLASLPNYKVPAFNLSLFTMLKSSEKIVKVNVIKTSLKTVQNNKETLAQVFTDVRYTKKNNEFFSEKFLNALKQQGFIL